MIMTRVKAVGKKSELPLKELTSLQLVNGSSSRLIVFTSEIWWAVVML